MTRAWRRTGLVTEPEMFPVGSVVAATIRVSGWVAAVGNAIDTLRSRVGRVGFVGTVAEVARIGPGPGPDSVSAARNCLVEFVDSERVVGWLAVVVAEGAGLGTVARVKASRGIDIAVGYCCIG